MSEYTPTAIRLPSTVEIPGGGEPPSGAVLGGAHEVGLDAIKALDDKLYGPITLSRHQWNPEPIGGCEVHQWGWTGVDTSGIPSVKVISTAPDGPGNPFHFQNELYPAHGATLLSVRVYVHKPDADARVVVAKLDMQSYATEGGVLRPVLTILGDETTLTAINADNSYVDVDIAPTDVVDRSRYRYFVQVGGTGAGSSYWYGLRVNTNGGEMDKGAG